MNAMQPAVPCTSRLAEPDSLEQLIGDSRRMAVHWQVQADPEQAPAAPVSPGRLRGITVPAASAHVVAGMAEFADWPRPGHGSPRPPTGGR